MSEITHLRMGQLWQTWCGKTPDQSEARIAYGDEIASCGGCRGVRAMINDPIVIERADCKLVGYPGHLLCGTCEQHQELRSICQCLAPLDLGPHDTLSETKETKMSEQKIGRDKKSFRLGHIRVHRIGIESEPSKSMAAIATRNGREVDEAWQDIVITVEDRAGNVFEVERFSCQYDGMMSVSTADARLVKERSWRDEVSEEVNCAICFFPGHGAGACDRVKDHELPWPKPISHYDSDGPRDGGPVEFNIGGNSFLVVVAHGVLAPNTGRDRYKVVCRECDEILHEATTGASNYIEGHLRTVHSFHTPLTHRDPL